jgi:hypothetical protein
MPGSHRGKHSTAKPLSIRDRITANVRSNAVECRKSGPEESWEFVDAQPILAYLKEIPANLSKVIGISPY